MSPTWVFLSTHAKMMGQESQDMDDPGTWNSALSTVSTLDLDALSLLQSHDNANIPELTAVPAEEGESYRTTINCQVKWSREEVLCMLSLYKELQAMFTDPKKKKKAVWGEISRRMEAVGYHYSGEKCETKFKNMKQKFTKTVDHNNKTGSDRKICPFYDELNEIFGMSPTMTPPSVCSSREGFIRGNTNGGSGGGTAPSTSSSESAVVDSPFSNAENKSKLEKGAQSKKRKRVSGCNKESLVDVFIEYRKERKEEEAEKQKKLSQMHEDKMKRFDRLLDYFEKM